MRGIKFRGWHTVNEVMFEIQRLNFPSKNGEWYLGRNYNGDINPDNVILMQFTGLLDRNGVEIYEGDIIKYYNFIEEVKFENFSDGDGWSSSCILGYNTEFKDGIIIGNIYENPELLEK